MEQKEYWYEMQRKEISLKYAIKHTLYNEKTGQKYILTGSFSCIQVTGSRVWH
jgi:hypothetical protein